jgi:hypothetical protein
MDKDPKIRRLIAAAKRWAEYQEGEKLAKLKFSASLQAEEIEAREALLETIDSLDEA